MLKSNLIPCSHVAALLVILMNAGGSEMAFPQQYYYHASAGAYTQVGQGAGPPPRRPAFVSPPTQHPRATGPVLTAASQPVVTTVQVGPAYAPTQVPLSAAASYAQPANSWAGTSMSYPQPGGQPAYCYGTGYPECSYSYHRGKCDWYCQAQKKLRSLYRASHRRSECEFEYPVLFPSGSPYGYVEPTWSRFCDDPATQVIEPPY